MTKLLGLVAAALLATATPAAAQAPSPATAGAAIQTTAAVPAPSATAVSRPGAPRALSAPEAVATGTAISPAGRGKLPFSALDVAVLTLGSLILVAMGFVLRWLGRPSGFPS